MAQEDKILNKIKGSLKSGNQGQLGTKNNDECYTSMADIYAELSYWAKLNKFKGKHIICPCDWDIVDGEEIYSITITYKDNDVEVTGNNVYKLVKEVQYDLWSNDPEPSITTVKLREDEIENFLRNKLTCNFINTFTQHARAWGIKSITASGYNPGANLGAGKGVPFQDVDYSKYDLCVTNPPFSLYGDFMEYMHNASIAAKASGSQFDFIVLAPLMNRANPCIGQYLMLKQAYLGHGIELHLNFSNPTKSNAYHTKVVNCDWITSFSEAQAERNARHFTSGVTYEDYKSELVEMTDMTMKDGTHPIRVSMSSYPEDYDGWMFCTIGVLDNLDQEGYEWYITNCKGYLNNHPEENPFAHKLTDTMVKLPTTGKGFHGVLFRKKQFNKESK